MSRSHTTRKLQAVPRPVLIIVPPSFAAELDRLTAVFAERTGEPVEDVRRAIEVTVLQRGIDALRGEQGAR